MTAPPRLYLGIDLSGNTRASGYALIDGDATLIDVGMVHGDDDIMALGSRPGVVAVAIDCPLGLPAGMCCLDKLCACTPTNVPGFRVSEPMVHARVHGIFFTTKKSLIAHMIPRGIALRRALESRGQRVLEIFPFATKAVLFGRPIPKKKTTAGKLWLRQRLSSLISGMDDIPRALNDDELDAILGAYTALLLDRGEAEALGDAAEGAIVVPVAAAPAYTAST